MLGIGRLTRLWGRRGSLESFATTTRHAGDPTVRGDEGRRHFRITRRRRSRKLYKFALAAVCRIVRLAAEIDVRSERAARRLATCVSRPVSSSRRELLRKNSPEGAIKVFYRPPRGRRRRRRDRENCRNLRRVFETELESAELQRPRSCARARLYAEIF